MLKIRLNLYESFEMDKLGTSLESSTHILFKNNSVFDKYRSLNPRNKILLQSVEAVVDFKIEDILESLDSLLLTKETLIQNVEFRYIQIIISDETIEDQIIKEINAKKFYSFSTLENIQKQLSYVGINNN